MNLIVKIAWRNIMRHRGKSLIIGSILFFGALLMTVGNGVISGMDHGLRKNIVEGFCGDALLISDKQESDNVFLEMMGKAVQPVTNYKTIDSALKTVPYVKKWLPMGKNCAMPLNEEGGMLDVVYVLGVNMSEYREFFHGNLKVVEGTLPEDNTRSFVIMPTGWRKICGEYYSILLVPEGAELDTSTLGKEIKETISDMQRKHDIVYMGMNADNSTTDVRVPIRTVVKYRSLNTIWGMFPILDIESYRECLGYFSAQETSAPVQKETLDLLSATNGSLDDMFAEGDLITTQKKGDRMPQMLAAGSLAVAKDTVRRAVDLDAGAFNMVLVRLSFDKWKKQEFSKRLNNAGEEMRSFFATNKFGPGAITGVIGRMVSRFFESRLEMATRDLNKVLVEKKLGVRAISWKKATGMIGSMAVLIKSSLFVFVMFLFFVAIIIIVNTLSMAAIERTSEIGMMRAVGARKGFIRLMFFGETGVLSAVFGGAGILVGILAVNIIAAFNITTDNDMVQLLYGGDTFRPLLSVIDVVLVAIQLALVTLVAVIYPIRVASGITPLDAVSRE